MNKTLTLLALVLATAATSFAGTAVSDSKKVVVAPAPNPELFRANEWQVDAFVAGAAGQQNDHTYNGVGGGLGLSYFVTKYFGIGIDNSLGSLVRSGTEPDGVHYAPSGRATYYTLQADLIARYPIESWHLAPYVMVGGGSVWSAPASGGNGNVGAGLEYRINRTVGLFIDSRYIYGATGLSESLTRSGVRFAF